MNFSWVIGSGGLLGTFLVKRLLRSETTVFVPNRKIQWKNDATLRSTIQAAAADFFHSVQEAGGNWSIYWAAGNGTMSSYQDDLEVERIAFEVLVNQIIRYSHLPQTGSIFFASSAGALYAGVIDETIDETTPIKPINDYGFEKIRQEELLYQVAGSNCRVLIGRISTLYGPGQQKQKSQGLISLIARSILRNQPVHIFVPLDTMRDYLFVEDAAADIVDCMEKFHHDRFLIKIFAAERSTTVAEIISTFRRIFRRKPRIITCRHVTTSMYQKKIHYRSRYRNEQDGSPKTSLLIGISKIIASERTALRQANVK